MNYLFRRCRSLQSLPDISMWQTSNTERMRSIFYGCSSLNTLPDI